MGLYQTNNIEVFNTLDKTWVLNFFIILTLTVHSIYIPHTYGYSIEVSHQWFMHMQIPLHITSHKTLYIYQYNNIKTSNHNAI